MTPDSTLAYRRADQALSASVGEDFVALHVERGSCFGMADVTAAVWAMLEQPVSLDAIVDQLTEEYDVSREACRAEIEQLLRLMVQEGLVDAAQ